MPSQSQQGHSPLALVVPVNIDRENFNTIHLGNGDNGIVRLKSM